MEYASMVKQTYDEYNLKNIVMTQWNSSLHDIYEKYQVLNTQDAKCEWNKQTMSNKEKKTTNTDTLITNRKNYKKISGPSLESQLVDQQSNIKEHIFIIKIRTGKVFWFAHLHVYGFLFFMEDLTHYRHWYSTWWLLRAQCPENYKTLQCINSSMLV